MAKWTESAPGEYRKKLGCLEDAVMKVLGSLSAPGHEFSILFPTAHFELSMPAGDASDHASVLKDAWISLRHRLPEIACELEGDEKVYRIPNSQTLQVWVSKTFFVVDDPSARPETFFTHLQPTTRVELYYFRHASAVSVRASHWRYDFDGMLMTIDQLLDLVVNPVLQPLEWGSEAARLSLCLDELLELPEESPDDVTSYVHGMYTRAFGSGQSAGFPTKGHPAIAAGDTQVLQRSLTRESTQALVSACKSAGYTVTSAVHAALIHVTAQSAPSHHDGRTQITSLVRSARRHAPAPFNGPEHAVTCATWLSWEATGRKDMTFHDQAALLVRKYHDEVNVELYMRSLKEMARCLRAFMTARPPADFEPPSNPCLSSLGVLDGALLQRTYSSTNGHARRLHLTDIDLQAEMPTRQFTAWIYTFDGTFRMRISFAEAFYDREYISRILDDVYATLGTGLGIDLKTP